jgi:hypothetical protein
MGLAGKGLCEGRGGVGPVRGMANIQAVTGRTIDQESAPQPWPAPPNRGAGRQAGAVSRKEVIQPQLPLRLPCYDFTPITDPTLDGSARQAVRPPASGVAGFRGVTGGVYKAREHIHRGVLTRDY